MKVINLYGGPGSGKSTTAAGLFYLMKLHNYKVELVTEYAKDLVYAGHLETMLDQQEAIFAEQNRRQHILRGKVDWAITDSPLGLSLVYPRMNQQQKGVSEWPALESFEDFVLKTINSYDNVNVVLLRRTTFQPYGREHTLEQSQEIDTAIEKMLLSTAGSDHFTAYGVHREIVDHLAEDILGIPAAFRNSKWWQRMFCNK